MSEDSLGAGSVASIDRAGAHLQTQTFKMLVDGGKYLSSKLVLLQQVAELAQPVVSSGTGSRPRSIPANCRIAAE